MKPNLPVGLFDPFVIIEPEKERAVRFYRLRDDLKDLMGKILTIVDSSLPEERQNKAMKDLIKSNFRQIIGRFEDICFFGKQGSNDPELA